MLLVFGAPCQLPLLAGPEHGRTIPLADIGLIEILQCSTLLPYRAPSEEGGSAAAPRFRTIQFGPAKCVNNSTDLRCKSGIVCASLVMPTVNLTRILSEAGGISSVGIRMSSVSRSASVSRSVSSTIDP